MEPLSENVKKELADVISLEVHDTPFSDAGMNDLAAQKIDSYPDLRDSHQRFLANPVMKRYTAKELRQKR